MGSSHSELHTHYAYVFLAAPSYVLVWRCRRFAQFLLPGYGTADHGTTSTHSRLKRPTSDGTKYQASMHPHGWAARCRGEGANLANRALARDWHAKSFQGTLLVLLQCPIANSITLNSKMNQEASSIVLYIDPAWSLI